MPVSELDYEELSAPGGQCFESNGEQTPTTSDGDDSGDSGGGVEGVWISTGITSLDGKPLSEGVEQKLFIIEGAEGTWDGRHLQLKLRWIDAGMSLSLQLNAD